MITLSVIYFFIVFRTSRPPFPPSLAALAKNEDITKGMIKDTWKLLQNRNYMIILVIFTLLYTVYAGLGFVINPLL